MDFFFLLFFFPKLSFIVSRSLLFTGVFMRSPAAPGRVSRLRPRSPSPEREYKCSGTRFECVEDDMLTAQMNHLSHVIFFFSFPLVNLSVGNKTIQGRNLESVPGCKSSHKHLIEFNTLNPVCVSVFVSFFFLFLFFPPPLPSRL